MENKTPQLMLRFILIIILAAQVILAQGRHIASPQEAGTTHQTHSERLHTYKSYTSGHYTERNPYVQLPPASDQFTNGSEGKRLQNPDDIYNTEETKVERYLQTPDLQSADVDCANLHIIQKRRFQELIKPKSAHGNGRVSTVPAHSPGDGH